MKNQYFGDRRDYFKWSLLEAMLKGVSGIVRFTNIPMLTPDEGDEGKLTQYSAIEGHERLYQFLQRCIEQNRRTIECLREYWPADRYYAYRETDYFCHATRAEYFDDIPSEKLRNALVFLDADIGLEVDSMTKGEGDKYIRYPEVQSLLQRMSASSVLAVYQHIGRIKRSKYYAERCAELKDRVGMGPIVVTNNHICFLFFAKSRDTMQETEGAAGEYSQSVQRHRRVAYTWQTCAGPWCKRDNCAKYLEAAGEKR